MIENGTYGTEPFFYSKEFEGREDEEINIRIKDAIHVSFTSPGAFIKRQVYTEPVSYFGPKKEEN